MQTVLAQQRSGPMAACRPSRLPAPQRVVRLVPACRVMPTPLTRKPAMVVCSSSGLAHPSEESHKSEGAGQFQPSLMSVPNTTVARAGGGGGMGSNASLGAVMEKSKLQFVMPTPPQQAPKLDDGGDGGDIGKHNHNGGGGGDGGGDDDDDYFDEGGDGEGDGEGEGNSFFRTVVPESYDKLSVQAVLSEWMRTVAELPQIIRRAVEMGLFSSAQLVRFFSMDVRPNAVRTISRSLPPTWARDFVGRLMADPAFVQKLVLEATFAAAMSMWYEYRARGERFRAEMDLALINTIGMAFATAATVWLVAPTRSYGSVHKFPWQQMLDGLPNCVFDASGPLRQYSNQARVGGLLAKSMELSAVGALTGTITSLLSSGAVALHQRADPSYEPSVPVPNVGRSSGGLAAFFAVNANARYQLIGGMDRYLFGHANYMWTYVALTGAARLMSQNVGEMSRWWWQGLPEPKNVISQRRRVRRVVRTLKQKPALQLEAPSVAAAGAVVAAAAAVDSDSELMAAVAHGAAQHSSTGEHSAAEQQQQRPEVLEHSTPVTLDLTAHAHSTSSASPAVSLQQAGAAHAQAPAAAPESESSEGEESGSGTDSFEVVDQLLADTGSAAEVAPQRQLVGAGRTGSRAL